MATQESVRVYGATPGQAGIQVIERSGTNVLSDPRYGSVLNVGVLRRGPMGLMVPLESYSQYQSFYGDPRDVTWHQYADGSQLTPDAIEGFYSVGGGKGQLWLLRVALDDAKASTITLRNPAGADVVRISAANEGRWGGRYRKTPKNPLIYATARTFTMYAPGVKANEYADSIAMFSNGQGREYTVVSNTAANSAGEVVFTVGAQYSLMLDGISGPTSLTGTASYERYVELDGVVSFDLTKSIAGVVEVNARVLTGAGTQFLTQLTVGGSVYVNGEPRVVDSITSDTTATITEPFSFGTLAAAPVRVDNKTVIGAGTTFTDPITGTASGSIVYATINGQLQARQVAQVVDNSTLELVSGFTDPLVAAKLSRDNNRVVGVGTQFTTELQPGVSYLVDPNRATNAAKVLSVISNTVAVIELPFLNSFTNARITKQSLSAEVELRQQGSEGLAVKVGQGVKFPATHFSINVYFNGSEVYSQSDASLDPNDALFLETLVNDDGNNIVYRTGSTNYQKWIKTEVLWDSTYTTAEGADVRPSNGSGKVDAVEPRRIYTAAIMDYSSIIGQLLYPDPYSLPRGSFRVFGSRAPLPLDGTVNTLGNQVTGVSSVFRDQLKIGDYVHDPASKQTRKVVAVINQTTILVNSAFTTNLAAAKLVRCGYIETSPGFDLTQQTAVGKTFTMSFPQSLVGGHDGNQSGATSYTWSKYADPDANIIENAVWGKDLGLIRMACPGISDISIQKAYASYAQLKAFEFRAEIPSNYLSAATAEVFLNQLLGRSDFQSLAFPSYGYVASRNGGDRLISLSGDIMGGESRKAVDGEGYHRVFAGVDAVMSRITKLPIELDPSEEALLNLTGIQPLKFLYGNAVVFGARNTAISTLYDFVHVRRIQSNYVRVFLENRNLLQNLFQPNQPELLDNVIMVLENWGRREYKKGVFSRYLNFGQSVEIASTNVGSGVINDQATAQGLVKIINGKLEIFISYVPTGIVETLGINIGPDILVENYGASLQASL